MNMKSWRRVLGQRVRRLSPDRAREIIDAHAKHKGIGDPNYRELTGGFSSQSIDSLVTRKLAVRCGMLKRF